MTGVLAPVRFEVPLVNPSPGGLYPATVWSVAADGEPLRWLPAGVEIRPRNFGGEDAFGVWTADWDAALSDLAEDDVKTGVRPDIPDVFAAMTVYGYDECWLHAEDQTAARVRAEQNLRLLEPVAAESQFAERMLADAPALPAAGDLVDAVGALEAALAATNTLGFVHASPRWLARASASQLVVRSGSLKTPGGHQWVFGGGYVDALEDTLVATSQPFGWRGPVLVRSAQGSPAAGADVGFASVGQHNRFAAVAERSLVIGYEAAVGAVQFG